MYELKIAYGVRPSRVFRVALLIVVAIFGATIAAGADTGTPATAPDSAASAGTGSASQPSSSPTDTKTTEEPSTTVKPPAKPASSVEAAAPLPAPSGAPPLIATVPALLATGPSVPGAAASAPAADYTVLCQYALTGSFFDLLENQAKEKLRVAGKVEGKEEVKEKQPPPTQCPSIPVAEEKARILQGPGDLMVVVPLTGYEDALNRSKGVSPLRLFLNGFDLGSDGYIQSAERNGDRVALRFSVPNKKDSQAFWTTIFSEHGLLAKVPLQASIGWPGNPAFIPGPRTEGVDLTATVTTWYAILAAGILAGLLVWFFVWALVGSDTFRVAPTYPWWHDARSLQTKLHRATVPFYLWPFQRRRTVEINLANSRIDEILKDYLPGFSSSKITEYDTAAQAAIEGMATTPNAVRNAVVGLALRSDWGKFRLPFSLAKVQWGGWMTFASTAAVFLWLVYTRFPVLEGSVLGLVGVSTLTAGASLIIDNASTDKNTVYSRGFFYDIMTDNNGVQQAHRYQAIVVNILLLFVGIAYVWQHLAYPTFDQSWLELLGISGLAQVAGKGTLESKPAVSSTSDVPTPTDSKQTDNKPDDNALLKPGINPGGPV